ncbi:MAG: FemAB family PEP-CTERM system-associated protein [Burkholderiaceae bacterium]
MDSVQIRTAADADEQRWRDYVALHPQASVFHDWSWRGILGATFGYPMHFLYAQRNGAVTGVLPLAEVRTMLFGSSLVSLPFCSWAGSLASDDDSLKALDKAAGDLADRLRVDNLQIRTIGAANRGWPTQDLYVMFRRTLSVDHTENMNAIPRKQRAMVRKGIKNELRSEDDSLSEFYKLYSDNVHRHGTPPVPLRFFEAMQQAFGDRCRILSVRAKTGERLTGVLSLCHRDEILPFYAGDTPQARTLAANDFKYWEVMRRATDEGFRVFNYGRSKRGSGSFAFKANWGFEPTPLAYEFRLKDGSSMPQNNPTNPKYRLLIETWRRMPRWAVNTIGPRLVRGLG